MSEQPRLDTAWDAKNSRRGHAPAHGHDGTHPPQRRGGRVSKIADHDLTCVCMAPRMTLCRNVVDTSEVRGWGIHIHAPSPNLHDVSGTFRSPHRCRPDITNHAGLSRTGGVLCVQNRGVGFSVTKLPVDGRRRLGVAVRFGGDIELDLVLGIRVGPIRRRSFRRGRRVDVVLIAGGVLHARPRARLRFAVDRLSRIRRGRA